jgi:hypothetical protein
MCFGMGVEISNFLVKWLIKGFKKNDLIVFPNGLRYKACINPLILVQLVHVHT